MNELIALKTDRAAAQHNLTTLSLRLRAGTAPGFKMRNRST
jgi:hypothetical protein